MFVWASPKSNPITILHSYLEVMMPPETIAIDPSVTAAARGREITGLDIYRPTTENITAARVVQLMSQMNADAPQGGEELQYGIEEAHRIRYWRAGNAKAPLIVFIHGGSWRSGTYLDSVGSLKVRHLIDKGYVFASVNYTLIPSVTVEEQVQEVAHAVSYMVNNAESLEFDSQRVVLMGHSSSAHVVALLGTDTTYLERATVPIHVIHGVVALDGSNYNAAAEVMDSPGPVADSTTSGLGTDLQRLNAMSPLYHARGLNARAFLLLQAQRQGDIRQAVEFSAALKAAGTEVALHVFEGESFEGHMAMLLRIGDPNYPATQVLDHWLARHAPSQCLNSQTVVHADLNTFVRMPDRLTGHCDLCRSTKRGRFELEFHR